MLKQIEGSHAMAEAIALCRPEVICAYPITPQTHIVEGLGDLVKAGELKNCEFINVESEFAALSVAIGASAAGARAYTATASQGLLFMAEAVYNAAGLGLPIVMTLGNRAIGAPINIWNDHSDAMSMRDAGWIQLFAETNQEAVDLHIHRLPAGRGTVDAGDGLRRRLHPHPCGRAHRHPRPGRRWTRSCRPMIRCRCSIPRAGLDRRHGRSRGFHGSALPRPLQAAAGLAADPALSEDFAEKFGRAAGGLLRSYRVRTPSHRGRHGLGVRHHQRHDRRDARGRREIGGVCLVSYRPFPVEELRDCSPARSDVVVVEKSIAVGVGGALADNVDAALRNLESRRSCIRPSRAWAAGPFRARRCAEPSSWRVESSWDGAHFIDLNERVVGREIHRVRKIRRSGATAENILRQLALASQLPQG